MKRGERPGGNTQSRGRSTAYSWRGPLALAGAAAIWGGLYSVVKVALVDFPPLVLVACEYLLATAILIPIAGRSLLKTERRVLARLLGMSLVWLCGTACMFVGVKYTSSGLAAFIIGQVAIVTPLLLWLRGGSWPGARVALALAFALAGMAVIFLLGSSVAYSGLTSLVFLAMLAYSVHIMILGRLTHQAKALVIVLVQATVTAAGSLVLSLLLERWPRVPGGFTRPVIVAILYAAVFSTFLAFLLQTLGQRHTPTTHVGIYLRLETVFALVISVSVGLDTLDGRTLLGFALIFAGTVLAQTGKWGREHPDPLANEPELELRPPL
jgi:drug/metabolite transporter (DMT)-like permease